MFSQLTLPPLIPVIIFLSMMVGSPFVKESVSFENATFDLEFIKQNIVQYTIGSLILATAAAAVFGFGSYFLLKMLDPKRSRR